MKRRDEATVRAIVMEALTGFADELRDNLASKRPILLAGDLLSQPALGNGTPPRELHWADILANMADHVRVIGPTHSGKTTLAEAMATVLPGKLLIIDPVWEPGSWGGLPAATIGPDGTWEPIRAAILHLKAEMGRRQGQLQSGQHDFERLTVLWDEVPATVSEVPEAGDLIRHIGQWGRHFNIHLMGLSQSDRVGSWGLENYGDAAENFATVYLGDTAVRHEPDLAGRPSPALLVWRGVSYILDITPIRALAKQPIDAGRAYQLAAKPVPAPVRLAPAEEDHDRQFEAQEARRIYLAARQSTAIELAAKFDADLHPRGRDGKFIDHDAVAGAVHDVDERRSLLRKLDDTNKGKLWALLREHAAKQWEEDARAEHGDDESQADDDEWSDEATQEIPSYDGNTGRNPTEKDAAKANKKLEKDGNPYRIVRLMPDPPQHPDDWDTENPEPEEPNEWDAEDPPLLEEYTTEEYLETTAHNLGLLGEDNSAAAARKAAEQEYKDDKAEFDEQQKVGYEAQYTAWEKEHAAWDKAGDAVIKANDAWEAEHGEKWAEYESAFGIERRPVEMATGHAPAGGIEIDGKQFYGGEFIPAKDMKKATAEQKQQMGINTEFVPDEDPDNVRDDAYKHVGEALDEHGANYTTVLREAFEFDTPEEAEESAYGAMKDFGRNIRTVLKSQAGNVLDWANHHYGEDVATDARNEFKDDCRTIYRNLKDAASALVDLPTENWDDDPEVREEFADDNFSAKHKKPGIYEHNGSEFGDALQAAQEEFNEAIDRFSQAVLDEVDSEEEEPKKLSSRRRRPIELAASSTWSGPNRGPRGGTYWISLKTGRHVYGRNPPSEDEHQGDSQEDGGEKKPDQPPADDIVKPKHSLGLTRAEMPQIPGPHVAAFLKSLTDKGVTVEEGEEKVGNLRPTQGELSTRQMDTLRNKVHPDKLKAHIIVSADDYILDGHHRWGELARQNENNTIKIRRVGLPIKALLHEAKNFEHTTYKDSAATGKGLPPMSQVPPLREPTGPEDMEAWMKEAFENPYIKEAQRRIDEESDLHDTEKKYKRPDGSWDPERVKNVHEPIIDHFLNPKAVPKPGEKPKAVFLIGPFGAGKSTAGQPIVNEMMPNYTLINPDDVKAKMPESAGWNGTQLHEESSHISKQIAARAGDAGHHLLYDGSGQNGEKMNKMATELAAAGYDVHVVSVTVPKHVSVHRAAQRFLENPFGLGGKDKAAGRYAPLKYVHEDVDSKPDATYHSLKNNPAIKSGVQFNTHGVKLGDKVPKTDHWERDTETGPHFHDETVRRAAAHAHKVAGEWQDKLKPLGVKVVMGGSLVSGLALPSDVHDMDIRFLSDKSPEERKAMIPQIEQITGLKFKKSITAGGGSEPESEAHMIEGKLERGGVTFDVEGQLRDTNYTGWAKFYPQVMSKEELANARQKKMELRHDKPAYKEYKKSLLKEVEKRVKEKGLLPGQQKPAAPAAAQPAEPRRQNPLKRRASQVAQRTAEDRAEQAQKPAEPPAKPAEPETRTAPVPGGRRERKAARRQRIVAAYERDRNSGSPEDIRRNQEADALDRQEGMRDLTPETKDAGHLTDSKTRTDMKEKIKKTLGEHLRHAPGLVGELLMEMAKGLMPHSFLR